MLRKLNMVDVAILKMHEEMTLPHYAHQGDAGIDLRSAEDITINAAEQALVATGIKVAIPQGYVGLVWDKSGHAAKRSITTMAGVIDSGYRGEIKVVLRNFGSEEFKIEKDMKIAQLLIQPVIQANIIEVKDLAETVRGKSGFGSTGKF